MNLFVIFLAQFQEEITKVDKVDSTLVAIPLKEALIDDIPFHRNLVKYVLKILTML